MRPVLTPTKGMPMSPIRLAASMNEPSPPMETIKSTVPSCFSSSYDSKRWMSVFLQEMFLCATTLQRFSCRKATTESINVCGPAPGRL